jgi:hypothetical protein
MPVLPTAIDIWCHGLPGDTATIPLAVGPRRVKNTTVEVIAASGIRAIDSRAERTAADFLRD